VAFDDKSRRLLSLCSDSFLPQYVAEKKCNKKGG
jgi:hypothetical protein